MRHLLALLLFSLALNAQTKLSERITLDATPASGDKFFILDADDATSLKGITYSNLMGGNAATATALAANPADCSAGLFATTIAANGALTCGAVAYADVTGTPTLRYQTVDDEDTPLTQRGTINFEGAGVSCADDTDQTTCTISAGTFDPMSTTAVYVRDEFMAGGEDTLDVGDRAGQLGWFIGLSAGDVGSVDGEVNHPGILRLTTGTTDNNFQKIYLVEDQNGESLDDIHNVAFDSIFYFRLDSCTDSAIRIGFLIGNVNDGSAERGIYLRYDSDVAADNFYFVANNGGTPEVNDTTVACNTGWNKARIYSSVAGTINLDLNGSNVATENTQLPSTGTSPMFVVQTRSGASVAKNLDIDFFAFSQTVTR